MRIVGEWYPCDDAVLRPVLKGEIQTAAGSWLSALLLIDSGADRTVLAADVLPNLGFPAVPMQTSLGGVGGVVEAGTVSTRLRFLCADGSAITINGTFAAFLQAEALDITVLGRDVLGLFTLILDWPGNAISLLGPPHQYLVQGPY